MNLVIVESPAKAKTINKYLGKDYLVLASYGHIRDLPSKNGSVDPDNKFQMEWEIDSFSKKYLKEITNAAEDSDKIILATDPDREGEAIAWHVKEVLDKKKLLKGKHLERVVFNEITKKAILDAIKNPREIHLPLVEAYLARRALDYLVGFNISPILWTKLPGSKSAGRVQSVALKLITEREKEIELFKPEEYWTLTSDFTNKNNKNIFSKLSMFNGEKIERFSFKNKEEILTFIIISLAEEFINGIDKIKEENNTSIDKLKKIIALHVDIATKNTNGMASLNNDWMHLNDQLDYYLSLRVNYEDTFRTIINEGIKKNEIKSINSDIMLFSILSTLRSLYIWIPQKEDMNSNLLATNLSEVLLKGINK